MVALYYGKASDQGASNGNATFLFFDDFNNGAGKWIVRTGAGSGIVNDSGVKVMKVTNSGGDVNTTWLGGPTNEAVKFKVKYTGFSNVVPSQGGPRGDFYTRSSPGGTCTLFRIEQTSSGGDNGGRWWGTGIGTWSPGGSSEMAKTNVRWNLNTWYTINLYDSGTQMKLTIPELNVNLQANYSTSMAGGLYFDTWDTGDMYE